MISLETVEDILKQHGISSIEDSGTGSSLEDDLGLKSVYKLDDVMVWLGY